MVDVLPSNHIVCRHCRSISPLFIGNRGREREISNLIELDQMDDSLTIYKKKRHIFNEEKKKKKQS
jgi:hypothetical protein